MSATLTFLSRLNRTLEFGRFNTPEQLMRMHNDAASLQTGSYLNPTKYPLSVVARKGYVGRLPATPLPVKGLQAARDSVAQDLRHRRQAVRSMVDSARKLDIGNDWAARHLIEDAIKETRPRYVK